MGRKDFDNLSSFIPIKVNNLSTFIGIKVDKLSKIHLTKSVALAFKREENI